MSDTKNSSYKFKSAKVHLFDTKEFALRDLFGDVIMKVELRHLDFSNPIIKAVFARYPRDQDGNISNENFLHGVTRAVFVGWEMTDEDGVDVPFSPEIADEFFAIEGNEYLLGEAAAIASTKSHFIKPKDLAKN